MAESSGDQEHVQGTIAGQSFALTTRDLIPVLLLLAGAVGGYLVYQGIDKHFERLEQGRVELFQFFVGQDTNRIKGLEAFRVSLENQNLLLMAQTEALRKLMIVHDFNACKPQEERVPLDLDPAQLPPSTPGGP